MSHWLYLKYVIRHKWFVFIACRRCGVGLWQALIHDWHKFLPSEWFPYVNYFYGEHRKMKDNCPDDFVYFAALGIATAAFEHAWNLHQKRARHHWQFWILTNDSDRPKTVNLKMPDRYMREMVADWWGAGRAITGKWEAHLWYDKNKQEILLSPKTREDVEKLLAKSSRRFEWQQATALRRRILGY